MAKVVVIGAGIFGVSAALALRSRGHSVTVADPGPIPHPLAESTDISKIVRLDYGADAEYAAMMEEAIEEWRRWNERWSSPLFHESGVLFLARSPMEPGGFEHDSFELLRARGHRLERVDASAIRGRFPIWNAEHYVDGYYNPVGGWAESGAVVAQLANEASAAGVQLAPGFAAVRLAFTSSKVSGVVAADGARIDADIVVVAAGSWTPHLLPALAPHLRSVGQPVFHLSPAEPARFEAASFPVFAADIARTGWYGFPLCAGVVKIANHGVGREMHPESSERSVTEAEEDALRAFLRDAVPTLASAPIAHTRVCVYCDTWDQHFLIAPHPEHENVVVAAGGSGHAFKFAPLVGTWIADATEGRVQSRFRFRADAGPTRGEERARHQGTR